MPPLSAATMFSRAVQTAEDQRVIIANMKPQAQPAKSELNVQANTNKSEPAEEKTLLNAALIPIAMTKPSNAPITPATAAITIPSITANALTSERVAPMALKTPSSTLLDSASIKTIVKTRSTPAAIVKLPNTKNMLEITPLDSAAALAASTLTAVNCKLRSSLLDISSNQELIVSVALFARAMSLELKGSPAIMRIERSFSADADNFSP